MRRFFESVVQPLLELLLPRRIVEIGIAEGSHSALLAEWCLQHDAHLHMIDTAPRFDTDAFVLRFNGAAEVHIGRSLDVLPTLPRPDLALIDGDHNWYTVYHELQLLFRSQGKTVSPGPICVLHDTSWPYGRRDLYYDPSNIPERHRHPWCRGPLLPDDSGIADFGLNPHLHHARHEGGLRNGVQTAIEDFVAEHPGSFRLVHLPVLFGLTLLVPMTRLSPGEGLKDFLASLELSPHWRNLLQIEEAERCYGTVAAQRLAPLPRTLGAPYAGPVSGRSFSPNVPGEILSRIQDGTMRYRYRDRALYKNPFDLALYLRLIGQLRPRSVLEIGTAEGGSALWFADMMTALGIDGRVLTIDRKACGTLEDPRITVLVGEGTDLGSALPGSLLATLPRPWLVVEDSAHTYEVSLAVLLFFDRYLHPGDYIVIEDGVLRGLPGEQYLKYLDGPSRAIESFLMIRAADYEIDTESCDYYGFNVTYCPNGWLKRR